MIICHKTTGHNSALPHTLLQTLQFIIRKTCPCNEYPFKPQFYYLKVGLPIFLVFAQKHRLWVLVRTALKIFIFYILKNVCILHGRRNISIGIPLDFSIPTEMTCIEPLVENVKSSKSPNKLKKCYVLCFLTDRT